MDRKRWMRACGLAISAACLGLLPAWVEARQGAVRPHLNRLARRHQAVRVIVQLDVPAQASAGTLESTAAITRQPESIAATQRGLAADLGGTRARVIRQFKTIPFVALEVGEDALAALERSGAVLAVERDSLQTLSLEDSVPLVGAPPAWAAGFDGTGWTVAVLDTGTDRDHPFLAGKVVHEACFSSNANCPNGEIEQFGTGAAKPCIYPFFSCMHGTHVSGIAVGRGEHFSGVARGANLIAITVFSRLSNRGSCGFGGEDPCSRAYDSDILAALEHVFELRTTYRIAAVNLSLGAGRFDSQTRCDARNAAYKIAIGHLRWAGIATVAAAGNDGFLDAISAPACISSVVSVGATDKSDVLARFSNSATFVSLLAPGVDIISSVPGGEFDGESGTSQATPHVAGAWAILKQKSPDASIDQVLNALRSTGVPIDDRTASFTVPRIQIDAALDALPDALASAQGVQLTPDGKRGLVSKQMGGEHWAITRNLDDQTVTGNVFSASGGDPKFVWCTKVSDDGSVDPSTQQITYSCQGADACASSSCTSSSWSLVGNVTLPASFFVASNGSSSSATSAASPSANQNATAAPGVQLAPDGRRRLVSRDVAGERWAITQNLDDQTVTGNVFSPSGGDPKFVWCTKVSDSGDPDPYAMEMTYSCRGASRCTTSPCAADQWSYISEVTLPGSFFMPPR